MKLFRRFLPIKTSIQWPSDEVEAAQVVKPEVAYQLSWDEEDEQELEDFKMEVEMGGWNMVDSLAVIAGMIDPEEGIDYATNPTTYPWTWPRFAYLQRSSIDNELILKLDQDAPLPPIFSITAESLQVGFKI